MSSPFDNPFNNPFLTPTPTPTTTHDGQRQWGEWERKNSFVPEPQKSYESHDAYLTRINK